MKAVICADIIASSLLSEQQLLSTQTELKTYIQRAELWLKGYDCSFWGRVVRGDTLECCLEHPHFALRMALLLKTQIMLFSTRNAESKVLEQRSKQCIKQGVRVSVGVGEMRIVDKNADVLDGEAIYLAGRELDNQHTSGKEKVSIKRSLFFSAGDANYTRMVTLLLECIDVLLRKATDNQIELLYYKLQGKKEKDIAEIVGKTIPTINQQSTTLGWNTISDILNYYEKELYPL